MNALALKALVLDAVYQILDNWVFRILTILGGMLVLSTFMVGFREDEVVLFFGLKSWGYDTLLRAFGIPPGVPDPQTIVINSVLYLLFDVIGGNLGLIFCIAATAFFVPRMIEKGAADVLFHKPLTRWTFYVARYFTGLLFVGILSSFMAAGVYTGILVASGYNDPGIFFVAPLLTYTFGLVYALSMWIGTITRSTVAAILLTAIFFSFNGCVHYVWGEGQNSELQRMILREDSDDEEEAEDADDDSAGPVIRSLVWLNATLHYVLPKTDDADVMARKLRRAVNRPYFRDGDSLVSLFAMPEGCEQIANDLPSPATDDSELFAALGEPRFALRTTDPEDRVIYTLFRRPAEGQSASRVSKALRDEIERNGAIEDVERRLAVFGIPVRGRSVSSSILRWEVTVAGEARGRLAVVFRGAEGEFLYTLWIQDESGEPSEERSDANLERINRQMGLDPRGTSYEEHFTFSAPWKYNIFFSVGSSLAFVLVMLLLGWWKLARIEF